MSIRLLLALALALPSLATARTVRVVYKSTAITAAVNPEFKNYRFGLTEEQIISIRQLTNNQIDLGNVHYIDRDENQISLMRDEPGFSGVIYPDVPPPAIIKDFKGDPALENEWWIAKLHVPAAWQIATGQGVTIADCDAGYRHEETDLKNNMLLNFRYDLGNPNEPLVVDDGPFVYHGTAVAAIIAGVQDGQGTNGIAYDSKIVPLQNFNYDSNKDTLDKEEATAQCILKAIGTPGVNIIVLENQTENGSSETFVGTRDAVRLAMKSGITVVGAGGNYSVEIIEEAKDDTGSIIVGALDQQSRAASFTNFGDRLTVGAYGEALTTLYGPNGAMGDFGGTSGATPQVAATVAMMKEANPLLTPEQMRKILLQTRQVTADNKKAGGLLNTLEAVKAAQTTPPEAQAWADQMVFRQQLSAILAR
jgi:subtilisin family serine protease